MDLSLYLLADDMCRLIITLDRKELKNNKEEITKMRRIAAIECAVRNLEYYEQSDNITIPPSLHLIIYGKHEEIKALLTCNGTQEDPTEQKGSPPGAL